MAVACNPYRAMNKCCFVVMLVGELFFGCGSGGSPNAGQRELHGQLQPASSRHAATETIGAGLLADAAPASERPGIGIDAMPSPAIEHRASEFVGNHEKPPPDPIVEVPVASEATVLSQFREWSAMASRVAIAKVTGLEVYPSVLLPEVDPVVQVKTIASLEPVEVVRGPRLPPTISYPGGTVGDVHVFATHQPTFVAGQTYLIFFQDDLAFQAVTVDGNDAVVVDGISVSVATVKGVVQ